MAAKQDKVKVGEKSKVAAKPKGSEKQKGSEKAKVTEKMKGTEKSKGNEKAKVSEKPNANEVPKAAENAEVVENSEGTEETEKKEELELPPFEIITGERISPFVFKFQFKNVEYSSGRNKTFLCYTVEIHGDEVESFSGFVEDEHISSHAEEAFFNDILPQFQANRKYRVTWYVSSSPCSACAAKIANVLRKNKNLQLTILIARLFMWEEPEIQDGLRKIKGAGCKLKIMKPQDFSSMWSAFVEQDTEEQNVFTPWEDIQENFQYYDDKLAEILQ
ncbi:C-_U-editing enzyme APOBEC-2 [Protopterus annectens]|uniref:mRNA(cytosine(6666)) deaminase n=1 Tax=Protopterus annectens TaxID=7888 RepID=A0A0M3N1F2_PROAN|nr:C->U-editing enzyme APOBEC-2 [Protopterus annectens]AKL90514.1 APOBEC-2 [Protopterus annectens]